VGVREGRRGYQWSRMRQLTTAACLGRWPHSCDMAVRSVWGEREEGQVQLCACVAVIVE
jgi:hypothetical protein